MLEPTILRPWSDLTYDLYRVLDRDAGNTLFPTDLIRRIDVIFTLSKLAGIKCGSLLVRIYVGQLPPKVVIDLVKKPPIRAQMS